MSIKHIYDEAKRKEKCRVCGMRVKKEKMKKGRCSDCEYKNLKPIE